MRRLHPDEAQAWGRVMATVRPIRPAATPKPTAPKPVEPAPERIVQPKPVLPATTSQPARSAKPAVTITLAKAPPHNHLDGSWDRRLSRGIVSPDSSIDLHEHNLASAHQLLDIGLDRAIRRGDRVLLLVTGKPPRPESERPHARGAIRAAVADWLAASRHADAIAAVRGAHPRHGGLGALYIVLRRPRGG